MGLEVPLEVQQAQVDASFKSNEREDTWKEDLSKNGESGEQEEL